MLLSSGCKGTDRTRTPVSRRWSGARQIGNPEGCGVGHARPLPELHFLVEVGERQPAAGCGELESVLQVAGCRQQPTSIGLAREQLRVDRSEEHTSELQ